jgi:predicted nucleotidyltransferase
MTKASSRLGRQLEEVIATLNSVGARFALIGGLALAPHNVVRATQDVDLLIDADMSDAVDHALTVLGYRCLQRSTEAANYLRGDQRLDFLYAHRPAARELLRGAAQLNTRFGTVNVVSAEGLIAFKLQGWVNNSRRTQDLEDIRALIRANRGKLNMTEVREYFRLFNRESTLEEILRELD